MATIKHIEKQVATANKNIAGYEKRIAMYTERMNKAIAALNKKGANITADDIVMTETTNGRYVSRDFHLAKEIVDTYGWVDTYRIIDNRRYLDENERNLAREIRHRDDLSAQLEKMVADANAHEQATAGLQQALEQAMADFRVVWFEKMRNWYESHFAYINRELEGAKVRRDRAYNIMSYLDRTRGWRYQFTSRVYKRIEAIRKSGAEIIMDDAANMDHDAYMAKMEQETIKSWNNGIILLTDKCHKFGLNEQAIKVSDADMTPKGFEAVITDETSRVVYVRVIWAAEYSVLVTPHIRYIATQRTK